jgi:hypothetical protein
MRRPSKYPRCLLGADAEDGNLACDRFELFGRRVAIDRDVGPSARCAGEVRADYRAVRLVWIEAHPVSLPPQPLGEHAQADTRRTGRADIRSLPADEMSFCRALRYASVSSRRPNRARRNSALGGSSALRVEVAKPTRPGRRDREQEERRSGGRCGLVESRG